MRPNPEDLAQSLDLPAAPWRWCWPVAAAAA
jgi:hypothetical protein